MSTYEILERFQSLCRELNCGIYAKPGDSVIRLSVYRDGPAPIEAHILAITPSRIIYGKTEHFREDK